MDQTSITAFTVGVLGAATTVFNVWYSKRLDTKFGKRNKCELPVVGLLGTYGVLDEIKSIAEKLFNETHADRFLLLVSEKHDNAYAWVSAIHEEHEYVDSNVRLSIGATSKYLKIETDAAYRQMLNDLREEKVIRYNVSTMPYGILREIYRSEMVTHSNVYYLYEFKFTDNDGNEKECILFASVATHQGLEFTNEHELKIKFAVDKIKNEILPKNKK
jgi:hypothetical protein